MRETRFRFAPPGSGPLHFSSGKPMRFKVLYNLVRLEEGLDRYTVLPGRFPSLEEAKAELDLLAKAYPERRFVLQVTGLDEELVPMVARPA